MKQRCRPRNLAIPELNTSDVHRFWKYVLVDAPDACWNWDGGAAPDGRGRFYLQGKSFKAPRIALWLHTSRQPGDMSVCHSCNNPPCCNPRHLYLGTEGDNARDRLRAGTQIRGEQHHRAKLTEREVREIRRLYATGKYSQRELAAKFGVSQHPIRMAVQWKTWKHVTGGVSEPRLPMKGIPVEHRRFVRGESHHLAKLTEAAIREIRHLYDAGNVSQRALAKLFAVSHSAIEGVVSRRTWKHV